MSAKHVWKLLAVGALLAVSLYTWPKWSNAALHVHGMPSTRSGGLDLGLMHRVESALMGAGIEVRGVMLDRDGVTVRLAGADDRDHAMAALKAALGANHGVTPATSASMP